MGYLLYRMLRAGMPRDWTASERVVALIIADDCNDQTRTGWITNAQLCEESGLAPQSLSKVLKRLASRGYEMRVAHGRGKDGRPVYATRGHATDYTVPMLSPRPESPCDGTPFSERKPVRSCVKARATARPQPSGGSVNKPPPQNLGVPSSHPEVEGTVADSGQDNEADFRMREMDRLAAWIRDNPEAAT